MTETVVSSASKEVRIGFERPFVIIGERINPTGRKVLAEEMKNGDYSRVQADAIAQVEAGAHMLDVNAGIPLADALGVANEAVGHAKLRRQLSTLRTRLVEGGVLRILIDTVDALPVLPAYELCRDGNDGDR